ncbi:hypothetical protein [Microvirga sp. M2]|uniref:hypothetical protein n=1 Tax=Microvirga sp. M2 TaxID=3073270 RepID=UPI0039C31939
MPGLEPGIDASDRMTSRTWMAAPRAAMTTVGDVEGRVGHGGRESRIRSAQSPGE